MASFSQIMSYINASLPNLNSRSISGIYIKIAEAISYVIDNTLTELKNTQTIIEDTISSKNFGHANYYVDNAKAYQVGEDLVINADTLEYYYPVIDPTKQLIAQAAFTEEVSGNLVSLILKVAKLDTNVQPNELAPLIDPAEMLPFKNYFYNFQIPGIPVSIISLPANELAIEAIIDYDRNYNIENIKAKVDELLITYKNTYPFNGVFYTYQLENYIVTNTSGLVAMSILSSKLDNVYFNDSTKLNAGYFTYGTNTLTYVAV